MNDEAIQEFYRVPQDQPLTSAELKAAIIELGTSQRELARIMGVKPCTMHRWCSARQTAPRWRSYIIRGWLEDHRAGVFWKPLPPNYPTACEAPTRALMRAIERETGETRHSVAIYYALSELALRLIDKYRAPDISANQEQPDISGEEDEPAPAAQAPGDR